MGKKLAKPFESQYAVFRRCLTANPGIPLSVIEANLRIVVPDIRSTLKRLSALQSSSTQPSSNYINPDGYKRQCPECAKILYHTDIFALPWLKMC
ncbi:MAG: hypothetical protein KZQ86_03400, partial [Candidatus Thiodiazotropha sp. (ex Lucinoma kastoroae)]|nr:hypothetical protein [Candidatus Thiodiazotropha sp. (ex Lucinoma kastoroae)]